MEKKVDATEKAAHGGGEQSPPAPPAPVEEARGFVARLNIVRDGETTRPGESIDLTRAEFDLLKPQGAVDGEWE